MTVVLRGYGGMHRRYGLFLNYPKFIVNCLGLACSTTIGMRKASGQLLISV